MKFLRLLCTLLFSVAVLLFFGMAYPHHLHYQEQYQLFLFDSSYVWEIVKLPGGIADLLGRFCTQFFLFAWVGALIITVLLSAVQLLTLSILRSALPFRSAKNSQASILNSLSFVPAFLLWWFLLDENALLGGVWAVLFTLLAVWGVLRLPKGWIRRIAILIAIPILYWMALGGSRYYRNPKIFPTLLYAAWLTAIILPLVSHLFLRSVGAQASKLGVPLASYILCLLCGLCVVWQTANFKAERVMQYDFMARHQQWNRILATISAEKPNNQIGVTVQNLALAMNGMLVDHLFDYNQNGIAGLLPDIKTDATSPLPTAEAFYQLGMVYVAQRSVFEAQEAILDFQKSGRCYKRLAETNLIIGSYEVARKYLTALQKTLFYREWANETLQLLGNEEAIANHPEYGCLRQFAYNEDFYFGGHVSAEMLESLYFSNTDNRLAYEYLVAYYVLTGNRESYNRLLRHTFNKQ
ncbi:MAG: hypothetical protein IJ580_00750 [Prevotella sp.]|nr:hypothetical protein [Prevotella sp.]MBR1556859.1 hypothetical protein [Prevotella sp.]